MLKIGDFGLAKAFGSPTGPYTHQVVTRWYRAPELLFGARMYGTGVDIWAVGCIIAELLLRNPFFPGQTDIDQLAKIFNVLGFPTEAEWPGLTSLPDYFEFKESAQVPFEEIFSAVTKDLIALLKSMFTFNPMARCTCSQALQMPYFGNDPPPTPPHLLPQPTSKKREEEEVDESEEPAVKRRLNF